MRTADRSRRRGARWLRLGDGALTRGSDRVELAFRLLLLLALLAAAPIAILQGIATYGDDGGISPQQAHDHQPVRAVVVTVPPSADLLPPDAVVQAPVTWTAPDGTPASATVAVMATTHAHDRITVWVSADGRLTGPPEERQPSLRHAAWAGTLTGLTVPLAAWALLGLAHLTLDARRSRQWQSEWRAVEPVWASRKP